MKIVALLSSIGVTLACSYSEQPAQDGTTVIARSLEFGPGLLSDPTTLEPTTNVSIYPPNTYSVPVLIKIGITTSLQQVRNKYTFLAVDSDNAFGIQVPQPLSLEGMNSEGLTVSSLVLTASKYEAKGSKPGSISFVNFCSWILGNMASVQEVREALRSVAVNNCWGIDEKLCEILPATHFAIADSSGESVVLEFLDGEAHIYNNTVGTMTNDPPFLWQVQNLQTYQSLSQVKIQSETKSMLRSQRVKAFDSQGFNSFGLPGDATPTSRFVRLYYQRLFASKNAPPATMQDALAQQQAIINSVYLPFGFVPETLSPSFDYTVWDCFKVPQTRTFGYKTYKNGQWKVIRLNDPNLQNLTTPMHRQMFDIENPLGLEDVTDTFVEM